MRVLIGTVFGIALCIGAAAAEEPGVVTTAEVVESTSRPNSNCQGITEDLKAMREAQTFMLNSMIRKNDSLAETLDLFAKDFSGKKGKLSKNDFKKMTKSADAFRGHSNREKNLIARFDSSTEDLLGRVQKCIEQGQSLTPTATQ